jgi:IMP dehydrogenase
MAIKMALNGGIGIIHRYMSIDEQVSQIKQVKRFLQYVIAYPYIVTASITYAELIKAHEQYGVSSFCVVDSQLSNNLIGIITHRDIEYMREYITQNPTQEHTATIFQFTTTESLVTIKITSPSEISHSNSAIDILLKTAKSLMLAHKIEKIPLVYTGTVAHGQLAGLITLKNIRHYENNKSKACIDSNGALCVGAAIGIVDDWQIRLSALVAEGVDLICIDVANGFNTNVIATIGSIRAQYPQLVLMAGNVCNWQGYEAMCKVDIDCIRVGVGNGSICTTRLETGIGKGQFSAVSECFDFISRGQGQGQTPQFKAHIICDGGSLGKTGNKVKALACGAIAVMLGRTLASAEESPGQIIFRNGKRFKYVRGMASTMANLSKQEKVVSKHISQDASVNGTPEPLEKHKLNTKFTAEGVDGEQELTGSVEDVIEQINGGLKSGLSYLGCETIQQLHKKRQNGEVKFNMVTSIGMSETGIRVKTY